jgi:hypothetical protein
MMAMFGRRFGVILVIKKDPFSSALFGSQQLTQRLTILLSGED